MISLRDCIEYLHLTADKHDARAEHEQVSPIVATQLASSLLELPTGERMIKPMIGDAILHAAACRRHDRVQQITPVL